jgi:hypothetical protein
MIAGDGRSLIGDLKKLVFVAVLRFPGADNRTPAPKHAPYQNTLKVKMF